MNEKYISYSENRDQIVIKGKLRRSLYQFLELNVDEQVNKKELLKYALLEALKLNPKDIILIKKKEIFIKIFDLNKIKKDSKEFEKNSHQPVGRFNGFSKEELETLANEYFDAKSLSSFLQDIAKEVFYELLIEKQVSNEFFEKNIFPTVLEVMTKEFLDLTNKDKEFAKGFAGYIFRINFVKFFNYMSDELLYHIYKKNEFLLSWLKYYDGHRFYNENKQQCKTQKLVSDDKQVWNPAAIYAKAFVWFQARDKLINSKKKVHNLEIEMENLLINGKNPVDYKKELFQKEQKLEKEISNLKIKLKSSVKERDDCKEESKKEILSSKIENMNLEINRSMELVKSLKKERFSITTDVDYKRFKEEKLLAQRDIERQSKILNENREIYASIQSAIVRVLTSKRICLGDEN